MVNKTISVFVITYNQQDCIRRTLDSILREKEWGLDNIIIGDDCSQDNTWTIIEEYRCRYPNIFITHRNETNMGIYANLQNLLSYRRTSDLYLHLAGDDELCEGFFKAIQEYIKEHNIDCSEAIGIYADYMSRRGDVEKIHKQNYVLSGNRALSLYIRRKLSLRSMVFSNAVLKKYEPIILDQGLNLSESMYDMRFHQNVSKFYHLPYVGSVYYVGIGVSTSMDMFSYRTEQSLIKWKYFYDHYAEIPEDKEYLKFCIEECLFRKKPTFFSLLKIVKHLRAGKLNNDVLTKKDSFMKLYSLFRYLLINKTKTRK